MRKKDWKLLFIFTLIVLIYVGCGLVLDRMGVPIRLRWLYWNLILSLLPMVFSIPVALGFSTKKPLWIILVLPFAALWLLFLPNSTYMITDLIHLDASSIVNWNYTYNADLKAWLALIYVAAGIVLGVVSGLVSTQWIYRNTPLPNHPILKYGLMILLSLLVGYGVYIGRFLRFNSWDILHPRSLLKALIADLDRFAVIFSFVIAVFFFCAYWIYQKVEEGSELKQKHNDGTSH